MSALEGGQNFLPEVPAERWRELYLEAAAENERLRAALAAERERCAKLCEQEHQEAVSTPKWLCTVQSGFVDCGPNVELSRQAGREGA